MSELRLVIEASDPRVAVFKALAAAAAAGGSCTPALAVVTVPGVGAPDAKKVLPGVPFRSLPVLQTCAGCVARGSAIAKYLACLAPASGLDGGVADFARAAVAQWMDWAFTAVQAPAALLAGAVKPESVGVARGAEAGMMKEASTKLSSALSVLDAALASSTFLVGQRASGADIALVATLASVWGKLDAAAKEAAPHATRWYMTVRHTPALVAVLGEPAEDGSMAKPAGKGGKPAALGTAPAGGAAGASAGAAAGGAGAAAPASTALHASALTAKETVLSAPKYKLNRKRVADVLLHGEAGVGETVTVCGWARTVREAAAGALAFVALSDGSTFESLQVVAEKSKTAGFEVIATSGGTHASFRATGQLVASPAAGQAVELHATRIELLGAVKENASYPLSKKRHTVEYLRDIQHLRPRTNLMGAVSRIRNACAYATHKFFQDRGFAYVHTPIITGSDCEGAGEMFQVTTLMPEEARKDVPRTKEGTVDYKKDFFGKPSFLTVSGQLQVEAFAMALSDVYTFGPTFRAEMSHTSRHLAEFWMIEPEISFATLEDDMALAEDYLKFCTKYVLEHCERDLMFFEEQFEKGLRARLENVVNEPFQVLTYTEAVELLTQPEHLAKGKFEVTPYWGLDLASEHERYITEQVFKKPVILINYPKDIKAFYMKLNPDGKTVAAMDVLVPKVGEIMGGSQREDDFDLLRKRMGEMSVGEEGLKWYLDLRKYGTAPHAGFGLGFERLVMYVTGIENIRDVIPFPRWPGNAAL